MLQKTPTKNIAAMLHEKKSILIRNNIAMHYIIAKPQQNTPKGTVLFLQGYRKTIAHYHSTINQLTAHGFCVIAPDFTGQGQLNVEQQHKLDSNIKDYRNIIDDLDHLLNKVILQNLPAPYYILADDIGAVFALIAHDLFANTIKRQVLVSPLFTPNHHHANSYFHSYCQIIRDLSFEHKYKNKLLKSCNYIKSRLNNKITTTDIVTEKKYRKATLGWHATILDAIAHIFSNNYIDKMTIPTLVYLPAQDNITHSPTTRQFVSRLRMARFINLYGAHHDILAGEDSHIKQFWQGFFAFIPGSAYISNSHKLEK